MTYFGTSAPYVHTTPTDAGLNVWRLFTEGWSATGAVLNVPAMFALPLWLKLFVPVADGFPLKKDGAPSIPAGRSG